MRWIRNHRRFGARLALFALALQLVLSFGHIHHEDFAFADPALAGGSLTQVASTDGSTPYPDGHADKHDLCAVCATISLAASTVLPEHASLPLPGASGRALTFELQTNHLAFQADRFFRARAPPPVS